jgi:cellulose synthase (UDP-forming)
LPSPPTDAEKYSYVDPSGTAIALSGLVLVVSFLSSMLFFIDRHPALWWYGLFCLNYIFNISFCAIGALTAKKFDTDKHNILRETYARYTPSVDIFLPCCGEPIDVLVNTYRGVANLDYPDYQVWVLDDGASDVVQGLASEYGFNYIRRPNRGELKKAGNLRHAFTQTEGEFILVFDADFVPRTDFLRESIFYFELNPSNAIVQTPQFFRIDDHQTDIQKGSSYMQESFYRLIQVFRNNWGASVCCGSCAIYRRKALEPFGGAYPVERSEDVNTGLSVLRTGWNIFYLPLNLAAGLSPDTISAFFHQHYRWCSGSLRLISSELFWKQKVSLWTKLCYWLSILYYLSSGLGTVLYYFPCLVNVWFFPEDFRATNYLLITPGVAIALLAKAAWTRNAWGVYVLITGFAASYTHLVAIIDVMRGNISPWIPTGSVKQ